MSHIVSIKTEVKDVEAVKAACVRLGLEEPVHGTARLFEGDATGLLVKLPGWLYAAVVDTGGPRLSVQSVGYFRAIVDDPYRFDMVAANHALGDLFGTGAEPQTALAIATVPYGRDAKWRPTCPP